MIVSLMIVWPCMLRVGDAWSPLGSEECEFKFERYSLSPALFPVGMLSCVLIVGLASLYRAGAAPGSGEDMSRDISPPAVGPAAARGALIWARPFSTAAALPSAARNYRVLYHSRRPDDSDVTVSGTVAIPSGNPPAAGWPLITWTHGTTGLALRCAPSSDTVDGPEHRYLSITQAILDAFVKRGYVVVATDYQGIGAAGTPAYLVGSGEGRSAIDIMRAAREIDPGIGTRYVGI